MINFTQLFKKVRKSNEESFRDERGRFTSITPWSKQGSIIGQKNKTHCDRGHPLSGDNLWIRKRVRANGRITEERTCRACRVIRNREYKMRKAHQKVAA